MLTNDSIVIRGAEALFGDARFTLYRITITTPKTGETGTPGGLSHTHSFWELHIIISGAARFLIGSRTVEVSCGEILMIAPQAAHYPCEPLGDTSKDIVLGLTLERVDGESGFYRYFSDSLTAASCRPLTLPAGLLHRFAALHGLFDSTRLRDRCLLKVTADEIIMGLFEQINGFNAGQTGVRRQMSREELHMMLESLINSPSCSLAAIARNLGYSERHTARLIKQIYGKNLNQIRQEQMLSAAKRILAESPELPLGEAAMRAGFGSEKALRMALRKHTE
ncbi:MAG: AraC family transcriptional regulator [Clostridia bacterium]|nr:AraC family transcriptional regulator [Clostridia bacterium]